MKTSHFESIFDFLTTFTLLDMLPLTLKALQATFVTQGGGETFWAPAPSILMPERWESKRWKAKALLYKNELFFRALGRTCSRAGRSAIHFANAIFFWKNTRF